MIKLKKNIFGISNCNFIIVGGIFMCLHHIFFSKYKHVRYLDTVFVNKNNIRITGWNLSHFLWFYTIGKFCPNKYVLFMAIGIIWEIFEKIYGKLAGEELYWTSNGTTGQLMDIIMNLLGYHLAHYI